MLVRDWRHFEENLSGVSTGSSLYLFSIKLPALFRLHNLGRLMRHHSSSPTRRPPLADSANSADACAVGASLRLAAAALITPHRVALSAAHRARDRLPVAVAGSAVSCGGWQNHCNEGDLLTAVCDK